MMEIQQYKFDVQHRPGKANANADALSRMYKGEVQYTSCFMMDYEYPPVSVVHGTCPAKILMSRTCPGHVPSNVPSKKLSKITNNKIIKKIGRSYLRQY